MLFKENNKKEVYEEQMGFYIGRVIRIYSSCDRVEVTNVKDQIARHYQ